VPTLRTDLSHAARLPPGCYAAARAASQFLDGSVQFVRRYENRRVCRLAAGLALVSLCSLLVGWRQPNSPTWVGEKQDLRLWSYVRSVLKNDLAAEDPEKTKPYVAMRFKYVARVAQVEHVVLVIVGMREKRNDRPELDYFKAYNVDLNGGLTTAVADTGFNQWHSLRWAQIEHGRVADAVFRFQSCSECEATYLLASFWFDPGAKRWKLREWPEDGAYVVIGSDIQFGDEGDFATTCLYAVRDYTGDGRDDVTTWCRLTGLTTKKISETLFLYTVSEVGPKRIEPVGKDAVRIKRDLCRHNNANPLCR